MLILGIIIGLIVLVILVVVHELGHALVAKRNGVVVEEFGIGFPPAAKKWKAKKSFLGDDVVYSVNWLPLGGFVKLQGEYDSAENKGDYGAAGFWVKTKILLAGVVMNWLVAILLFTVLALIGLPKILPHQVVLPIDAKIERSALTVGGVTDGSPAHKIGIQKGDQIVRIGQTSVGTPAELSAATEANSGKTIEVELVRRGETMVKAATLNSAHQAKNGGYLGVAPQQAESIRSTWSAPLVGVLTTGQLTYETLKGVGDLLVKSVGGFIGQFIGSENDRKTARQSLDAASSQVAGPIGILAVLFPAVLQSGLTQLVLLAAIISLTLAVMNILPIPALDGGRWFIMAAFRLFKKPLTKEREESIQATGMIVLLLLTILVTMSDVGKLL